MPSMRRKRYTKELLYREIANFRAYLGISAEDYPLDAMVLAEKGGLTVKALPFKTNGLKGALMVSDKNGYIFLNSSSTRDEQNFFCAHESMHFVLHRDIDRSCFQCFDRAKENQDSILEWQANEGAAEYLVPYRQFIPDLLDLFNPNAPNGNIYSVIRDLSAKYKVSDIVVRNRMENLKYEIQQVANGTSINNVNLLSKTQQERRGILIKSCYEIGIAQLYMDLVM